MFRLSKLIIAVCLALSLGLHWVLLQSAAWVGMAVSFSQTEPITEALSKTFDGKHPCKLCKLVKEGQQAEQKQERKQTQVKFDLVSAAAAIGLFPPVPAARPAARAVEFPHTSHSPSVPPPRTA